MTFKADKPSGGGDFAVRTSEVLAGDDRTLPDQLQEAVAQLERERLESTDYARMAEGVLVAERKRAEAAERKVDELERACARLNDVTWEWADWQQKAKAEVDEYRQALEGLMALVEDFEREAHKAGHEDTLITYRDLHLGDNQPYVWVSDINVALNVARDALREEQPQGGVRPREGGKYSLFCYDCGEWVPDTANNEMRKEGYFAHSHICAVGEPETQE